MNGYLFYITLLVSLLSLRHAWKFGMLVSTFVGLVFYIICMAQPRRHALGVLMRVAEEVFLLDNSYARACVAVICY